MPSLQTLLQTSSVAVVLAVGLSGCHRQSDAGLRDEVSELKATTNKLSAELNKATQAVKDLEWQARLDKAINESDKTATFDPSQPKSGFSKVQSSTGYFLVSFEDVQPYLDGQRVTLHIGNPLSVLYSGFKVKATWARRLPDYAKGDTNALHKAWEATKKEKEISVTQDLRPGSWNRVSFVVAPAKADEFGYLQIGIETNQVRLAAPR